MFQRSGWGAPGLSLSSSGEDFDRQAGLILLRLKSIWGGGLHPGKEVTEVKPAVTYLVGYMDRWKDLKIAINRI